MINSVKANNIQYIINNTYEKRNFSNNKEKNQ
jgi:hypothetical protein